MEEKIIDVLNNYEIELESVRQRAYSQQAYYVDVKKIRERFAKKLAELKAEA